MIFALFSFGNKSANAQVQVINHKLTKNETLYKLSILYRTEIDSVMKWNSLKTDVLSIGANIRVLDYNKLKLEELVYNQYVYDIQVKKSQKLMAEDQFNEKLLSLENRKNQIDASEPQAMQEFFEISKIKKTYLDSMERVKTILGQEIFKLRSEKDEIEQDILRKYPRQYSEQSYTSALKAKENEVNYPGAVSFGSDNKTEAAFIEVPQEEIGKAAQQKLEEVQKQWEKEENARLEQIAKDLKEQDNVAKRKAEEKASKLHELENQKEAEKLLELKRKEDEAVILLKQEQLEALAQREVDEAAIIAKQKKVEEQLVEKLVLAKQYEAEKLAQEKSETEEKVIVQTDEDDFVFFKYSKELAAMEAAKAQKLSQIEEAQKNKEVQASQPKTIIENEIIEPTLSGQSEVVESSKTVSRLRKETKILATALAKQKASAEKETQKQEKYLERSAQDRAALEMKDSAAISYSSDEIELLIFDVDFVEDQDTTSKKFRKQEEKISKEFLSEMNSTKATRTITVDEVLVKKSKKSGKFKMGDDVDIISREKSKFFLSRSLAEIDKSNYKKAIEYADKSIDLNPNYTEAYMLKGDMLASFAYYDKALNNYEKANILESYIPQLHYNMGNCLIYLGKKDKAIEEMTAAISIDSSYILAYAGRSALYIDMKDYQSALNDYNVILKINKYFYPALKGRGIAHINLEMYREAILDFNQLLEFDNTDPSIYYHRGLAKMYLSEIYGACMDFLMSSERGYLEAEKAIKKYCD